MSPIGRIHEALVARGVPVATVRGLEGGEIQVVLTGEVTERVCASCRHAPHGTPCPGMPGGVVLHANDRASELCDCKSQETVKALREDARLRARFGDAIQAVLDNPPEPTPAERLAEAGLDPERAALALVLARRDKAPEWARTLVEALAAKAEETLS